MKFGPIEKARIEVSRKVVRAIFNTPALHRRLHSLRSTPGLDPDLAVMLALDDVGHDSYVWRCSPGQARLKIARSVAVVEQREPADAVDVTAFRIPASADTPELAARLYAPPDAERPCPGLVYLHGGGWVTGDLDTHDTLCRQLARLGALRVVSVDYRLAPEHPFPAGVTDSVAAFRHVAARAETLGIDPTRIGVAGDSAGGNLSAVVSLRTRGDARRPALAVLLYPALDATCARPSHRRLGENFFLTGTAIKWYLDHYLGTDRKHQLDPDASPLLAPDVSGAPPTLLSIAAFDPLCDEAAAYAARLRAAGVPVVEQWHAELLHGYALMTGLSTAARDTTFALARTIGDALRRGLRAAAPERA